MARKSLEDLRKRFQEEKKNKNNEGGSFNRSTYPFWKMNVGEKAIVRILPDKNEDNPYVFYVDKLEHTLSINGKDKRIPCLKMYGDKCPICDLSSKYYKQEGKESEQGKYYYRKKISMVRVYVVEDPLPADETTGATFKDTVVNTQFSYQLMEKIREEIESGDNLENDPWDLEAGPNFIIKKSAQGQYGTYTIGSGFSSKSAKIPQDVELIDLSTLLPKNIGIDKVEAMLSAHINGTEYDGGEGEKDEEGEEEVGKKPAKSEPKSETKKSETKQTVTESKAKSETKPKANPVDEDDDVEDDDEEEEEDDLLTQIKNRNKKN